MGFSQWLVWRSSSGGRGSVAAPCRFLWKLSAPTGEGVYGALVCIVMQMVVDPCWIASAHGQLHWPGGHGRVVLWEHTMDTNSDYMWRTWRQFVNPIAMLTDDKTGRPMSRHSNFLECSDANGHRKGLNTIIFNSYFSITTNPIEAIQNPVCR